MISVSCNKRIKFEAPLKCDIQLGFEVDGKKYVNQIISSLTRKILGLHMKLSHDGSRIYYVKETPPIFKIQNFEDIEKASTNFSINHKNDPYTRFGSIGYNDNMVILSVSHSFADGGYFKYVANNILDDTNVVIPSHFPYEVQDIFKEKYEKSSNDIPFWITNKDVNRIQTNDKSKLHQATDVCYSSVKIPANKLQCYDTKNKKLHSFTNSLWTSYFISSIVHNNNHKSFEIPKFMCIPTCTDFRRYLKNQNYSICSLFSIVTPRICISPKKSLDEIGKEMKIDLNKRMEKDEDFGLLKTNEKDNKIINPNKKIALQLSYVGSADIKHPITDVFMGLNMDPIKTEAILCLMGFSCIKKPSLSDPDGKNDVILRLRYSPTSLHKDEVEQMMKNIEYILTRIPKETSLEETIKAVSSLWLIA